MSLEVVYKTDWVPVWDRLGPSWRDIRIEPLIVPISYDPNYHLKRDGEWHAVITMPHEIVEWEGYSIPAWEGDVERIEWERKHGKAS